VVLTPVFAVTTGLLTVAVFFVLDRLALAMIRPRRKVHARNARTLSFHRREHEFTSLGQELKGWFLEPEVDRGDAVVVLVHGWGSSHGRMTFLAEPLLDEGYPVFLFDVRYHGESPDAPYVTARHFRDDTMAATREAHAAYPDRPLVLIGHSMGGSAAILAVAEGAPAAGLVTIAAPADLWDVWADSFRRRGLPGKLIVQLFNPFWRYRAGVPFRTLRPERRVRELVLPLLIVHGDRDRSVPVEHARALSREVGVDPLILKGEGHNDLLGRPNLHREVIAFLQRIPG
jgi:alpha-beta hydrolase superfamily lysophospholipase